MPNTAGIVKCKANNPEHIALPSTMNKELITLLEAITRERIFSSAKC